MTLNWKNTRSVVGLALPLFVATCISSAQTKKLSMADARKTALAAENGKIKSEELEKEKGKLIYSFDIQMPDGVHEVNVDAMTGKIVEDSIENAQDEAKEAAEDAKAAKKKAKKTAAGKKPQ